MKKLTLITGGARSGKSKLAEKLARNAHLPVVYLATMGRIEGDSELDSRIASHVSRRPKEWTTIEEPLMVTRVVEELVPPSVVSIKSRSVENNFRAICLIDCLSLFVSNLLLQGSYTSDSPVVRQHLEDRVLSEVDELLKAIKLRQDLAFIVVTNEVGMAVVPENALARSFRDLLGLANQRFAASAQDVHFCVSGLSLRLKTQKDSIK
ncbi:MAG: bifunctional adenosylcobinamide kinase/adenosylcobinamide-phosphate guanylyltransferase [Cyanobacteria bacterium SZAS LIN-2]|nr:bifunctional adenosylcobinamide kinase/adenosylcobinamide-phosphate guanylyltransferase [Cyanobacteria bacterium SZAS LIN-2]